LGGAGQHSNYKAISIVDAHMKTMGLSDIFRFLHSSAKEFTRVQIRPFTASRIDFFLILNSLKRDIKSAVILLSIRSDHRIAQIEIKLNPKGPGYWKFNNSLLLDENSLLLDENYVSLIKNVISDFKVNNPSDLCTPHLRWNTLKCVIRGYTILFKFKTAQNSKNLRLLVIQVLNSKLGITLRVLVISATILTAKRTIHKNI